MDGLDLIKEVKEILVELDAARAEDQQLDLESKQLKKRLEAERQLVSDTIRQTVSARRGEIEDTYRKEIGKVQEQQKRVKNERSRAKAAGVKSRIEEETADLWEENRRLKKELNTRMKQDKVPSFCNTTYYYALYFTKGFKEIVLLLATFLAVLFAVPCGIYFLIPDRQVLHLVFIYIAVLVIFFGAYIVVGNLTKDKYMATLREGRKIRNVMANNRRRIRTITRSIEKDSNEAVYQLEDYDQKLKLLSQELDKLAQGRDEALRQFDKVTVLQIEREIEGNSQAQIEALEEEIQEVTANGQERKEFIRSLNLTLTDQYVPYFGKEFMNVKALDELAEFLDSGQAANLTEAKNLYLEKHAGQ